MLPKNVGQYVSVSEVSSYGSTALKYFTEEHANRGTMIHSLCHAMMLYTLEHDETAFLAAKERSGDESKLPTLLEDVASWRDTCMMYGYTGFAASCSQMIDAYELNPILVEQRLFDRKLLLTGRPDFIGFANVAEGLGIIDFKTSANLYPDWKIQLAGYWMLCEANGIHPAWAGSIRIRTKGTAPICNVILSDTKTYNEAKEELLYKLEEMRNGQ